MSCIRLAGGPVSWGVDFAGAPDNPPPEVVLDGIAGAGLRWLELGPAGYLPGGAALRARGLGAVGTFVFADFHRAGAEAETEAALDAIADAGGTLLILIDRPSPERAATAGRPDLAPRLGEGGWRAMRDRLRRAAERAAERGVRAVVHPHAGSFLEFEDEVDRLLTEVEGVGLCLDTGHALYAGGDPAVMIRRHAARLEHLHLKDVSGAVRARGLGFWDAVAAGVFCPVGDGLLDLPELRTALTEAGYDGFATIEQDRRPGGAGDPAADLRRSIARIREAGIAA